MTRSLVNWPWEKTHEQQVMSSNPGTAYKKDPQDHDTPFGSFIIVLKASASTYLNLVVEDTKPSYQPIVSVFNVNFFKINA